MSSQTIDVTIHATDDTQVSSLLVSCWDTSYASRATASYRWPGSIYQDVGGTGGEWFHKDAIGDGHDLTVTIPMTIPYASLPGVWQCGTDTQDSLGHGASYGTWQPNSVIQDLTVYRTPAGQPSAPKNVNFSSNFPSKGVLSWSSPSYLGSPSISTYVVQYSLDGIQWFDLPNGKTSDLFLTVSGLNSNSDYWFRIRGENGATTGQNISYMTLNWGAIKVHTAGTIAPSAPTGLVITSLSSSGFSLDWTYPVSNGGSDLSDFTVELSRDAGLNWQSAKAVTSTSTHLTVTGTTPNSKYLIRIASVNPAGSSSYLTGSVSTPATNPLAPDGLHVNSLGSNSLTLTWGLPSSDGGSAITNYLVEVSSNYGSSWTAIAHSPSINLGFDVTNLIRNRTYAFRVSAINRMGTSDPSNVVTITTLGSTVPLPPASLGFNVLSAYSAKVMWSSPSDTGGSPISDYRVEISPDGGSNWVVITHNPTTSKTITIKGLAAGTTYQVRVSALNNVGYGTYVSDTFVTMPGVASAPQNLQLTSLQSNSINLSWLAPISSGGAPITDYKVERALNCTSYKNQPHEPSASPFFSESGLTSGSKYCFRVSAQNSVGFSVASNVLQVTVPATAPATPVGLSLRASKNSVIIGWGKVTVTGGSPIQNYFVEFSTDGGTTWLPVPKSASTSNSLTASGLRPKTTYSFRVSAVNDIGMSVPSITLSARTP